LRQTGLELLDPQRGFVRLLAQRRGLARLREVQQDKDCEADDRGEASVGPDLVYEVMNRKGVGN
jgi:hypothetical protein